jgi:hypothetical protein
MEHFYDGQVKRYLNQFMRLMSGFGYKDAKGNLVQVPVRYGDMTRQVANVLKKNSENIVNSAPFIACYIKGVDYDRSRIQNPYHVDKMQIRERAFDEQGNEYINEQGENYTVERIMPTPYTLTFAADIWTTNTDQKLQLWEQIAVLFNPAMEIQTTNNFVDWTSLSYVELTATVWSSRSVPQGTENDIDIANLTFTTPIWITPPAKVKKMGIITKIITNIFTEPEGTVFSDNLSFGNKVATVNVTPGNLSILVLGNTAKLMKESDTLVGNEYVQVPVKTGVDINWFTLLDLYPGKFRSGLSQIRFTKPDGNEVVGYLTLNQNDDREMLINYEGDTLLNTPIADLTSTYSRGTVNAVINPQTYNPGTPDTDTRYLILEDLGNIDNQDGPDAWKNSDNTNFFAYANDIIQWDGTHWNVIFNSAERTDAVYITNSYTGIQYKWDGEAWSKSFEGVYDPGNWRLVL